MTPEKKGKEKKNPTAASACRQAEGKGEKRMNYPSEDKCLEEMGKNEEKIMKSLLAELTKVALSMSMSSVFLPPAVGSLRENVVRLGLRSP